MSKVTIYLPAMKLKVIDAYCADHKIRRSHLMANCTMSFINAKRGGGGLMCEYCKRNPAVGKYKVVIQDWEVGEKESVMNLCQKDLDYAKIEGQVHEI